MPRNYSLDTLSRYNTSPISFTIGMGKLIRIARKGGKTQAEIAKKVYLCRAPISELETGKIEIGILLFRVISYIEYSTLAIDFLKLLVNYTYKSNDESFEGPGN